MPPADDAALRAAVEAAAPGAPDDMIRGLLAARRYLDKLCVTRSPFRLAALIGQAAHESAGFRQRVESLYYTTAERLMAVWPTRFEAPDAAQPYIRAPEKLANQVYAYRMGNGPPESGDGWTFRGRGPIQITGRDNYRRIGAEIGIDLEDAPDRLLAPDIGWAAAGAFLATRSRGGRTALEWADLCNNEMVTRIINGGTHGLREREDLTARALAELAPIERLVERASTGARGVDMRALQLALSARGEDPGPVDGIYGPRTDAAVHAALNGSQEA